MTEVTPVDGGFQVSFANAAPVAHPAGSRRDRRASLSVPSGRVCGLSAELVTHTGKLGGQHLDKFKGHRVAVVGAGQSSLETAALLHELGAGSRSSRALRRELERAQPGAPERARAHQAPDAATVRGLAVRLLEHPARLPHAAGELPGREGADGARAHGSWWLKDRVDGVVDVLTGTRIREAVAHDNRRPARP